MAEEKRIEDLSALLGGGDRVGQIRAALDLVRVNTPQGNQVLISALNNASDHSRACAAMALGKLKVMGSVPTLARMLKGNQLGFFKDRSPEVRQTAAFSLGEIAGPVAIKALQVAYEKDEAPEVRKEAAQALSRLGLLTQVS
jgi:HEAT repeat protein